MIKIKCRKALFNGERYTIMSNEYCKKYFGTQEELHAEFFNERTFSVDNHQTINELCNVIILGYGLRIKDDDGMGHDYSDFIFIIEGLLFYIMDANIKVGDLIKALGGDTINAFLVFLAGRGDVLREDQYRFYMPSHEGNRHNAPHVHVEKTDGKSGTIDIFTLEQIDGNLKQRDIKRIKKILNDKQDMLINAWNKLTDGITIDGNYLIDKSKVIIQR